MNTRISTPIIILAVASLLLAGSAFAQKSGGKGMRDGRGGPPSTEERLARIAERLDLSDEQSRQMLALMQDHEQERKVLMDAHMEEIAPDICKMREDHESDVLAILDDVQAEQFLESKEKFGNRAKGRRGGNGGIDCSAIDY